MASREAATRRVSEGLNIDCRLAPCSSLVRTVAEVASSARPKASSSRLCSELNPSAFAPKPGNLDDSPLLHLVQCRLDQMMDLGRYSLRDSL